MKGFRSVILSVMAVVLAVVSLPAQTHAAPIDLSTSPLPINLTAKPGTTVTTDIRIKNNSETQKIKVSLMKFSAYGEEGKPALKDRGPGDDYFDWVSFSPGEVLAPKGEWVTIKMTINVPKEVGFSYYYAAIFTPANAKPEGKGNVLLGSTAVLVLLDVQNPNAKRTANVASFKSEKRVFQFLPATFEVKIRNSGNVHLMPHGNIFIKKGKKNVASLVVNTQQGNVLPGTNRYYKVQWNDGFPHYVDKQKDGRAVLDKQTGLPEKELKWNWADLSKFQFGYYTAHLTAVYDNGKQDVPMEATVGFWVIPWRILAIVLVVLVLIGLGLWATVLRPILRKMKKGKDASATKS